MHAIGISALGTFLIAAVAAPTAAADNRAPNTDKPECAARGDPLDALVRKLALDLLPHEYEDTDDWGKTKPFTTGVEIDLDGLRIDTERRRKELNHGTWRRYRVALADPGEFTVQVNNLRRLESGASAFTLELAVPLKAHARQALWQRGVQLYSISADARATIKLRLECETSMEFDATTFVPSMRIRPKVTDADIRLANFKLQSISKLHGEAARQLGEALEGRIARTIARKDGRLVRKINEKLRE